MAKGQAKTIDAAEFRGLTAYVSARSGSPESDKLKLLFSYRAGLRVCEIARLPVDAVLTPSGKIARFIRISAAVGKKRKARLIPMHPEIAAALKEFFAQYPQATHFAISSIGRYQNVGALTVWFHRLYEKVGLEGCSSHSGRRTFITQLGRRAAQAGCSLRDVQDYAGHARLDTTERYLDPSPNAELLIKTLGDPRFDDMDSGAFSDAPIHPVIAQELSRPRVKRASRSAKVAKLPGLKPVERQERRK